MKTHKGIKYKELKAGAWQISFPSGLKSTIKKDTEAEVLEVIEKIGTLNAAKA